MAGFVLGVLRQQMFPSFGTEIAEKRYGTSRGI
jgi:hypothetical protein